MRGIQVVAPDNLVGCISKQILQVITRTSLLVSLRAMGTFGEVGYHLGIRYIIFKTYFQ